MEKSGVSSNDSEGNDAFIVLKVIRLVRRINFLVNSPAAFLSGRVIGCKDDVIEGVIEGSIEDAESVGDTSLKFRLCPREGVAIGGESGPGIALLAENNEPFIDTVGQSCLDDGVVDDPKPS